MGKIALLMYTSIFLAHKTFLFRTHFTFSNSWKRIGRQNFAGIKISFLLTVCKCKFLSTKKEILLMPHSSKKGHFDAK